MLMTDVLLPGLAAFRRIATCAVALLALHGTTALAIVPAQDQPVAPPEKAERARSATRTAAAPAPRQTDSGKSDWGALTPAQQEALAPLAPTWNTLSRAHQRKWVALSKNFPRLQPQEQKTLHSRMSEWARLSTRERAQARLNFGETKALSTADKKAMWEAYQALSAEEKNRLAAGAPAEPPTAAAAIKPVAREKLTQAPGPGGDSRGSRIASAPDVDGDAAGAQSGPIAEPVPLQTR
jgi:hypothetical protein